MKNNKLKKINGIRIRTQYFNGFISFFLLIFGVIFCYLLGNGEYSKIAEGICTMLCVLHPLILLSIANRFLFGKIVCVIDKNGIYTEKGFIPWRNLDSAVLDLGMNLITRGGRDHSSLTLVIRDYKVTIEKIPLYLLRYVKKYRPDVKISLNKDSRFLLWLIGIVFAIAYVLMFFVE